MSAPVPLHVPIPKATLLGRAPEQQGLPCAGAQCSLSLTTQEQSPNAPLLELREPAGLGLLQ